MCKAIEENNRRLLKNKEIEIALSLIRMGKLSNDEIAEVTKLSVEEVEKLAATQNHSA